VQKKNKTEAKEQDDRTNMYSILPQVRLLNKGDCHGYENNEIKNKAQPPGLGFAANKILRMINTCNDLL
jgi:hypothetical protein